MFKQLIKSPAVRRRVSWLIAAILILPFVLFFHATGQAPPRGPGGTAGEIFGKPVPWEVFEEERLWVQRRLENQLGDVPEMLRPMLTETAWDRLILLEEARRTRLAVPDEALAASIRKIPEFWEEGRFLPDRYRLILRASGLTPQTFEARLRKDLLIEKFVGSVRDAVTVTDEEVRAAYRDAHETLTGSLVWFEAAAFADEVASALTEEDLRAHYEAHPELVRVPEQLVVECAGRWRPDLAAAIQPTPEELRAFYDGAPDRFTSEEGTVKPFEEVEGGVREQLTEERVRTRLTALAVDLEEDLATPLRFEEMVAARALTSRSAGPFPVGTRWVPAGLDQEVLQAADRLAEGQVSDVIETANGVFIVRVTQRIPSRLPPLEEVRERVREAFVRERARAAAAAAARAVRDRLKGEHALRFEEAILLADVSSQPVQFTRTQPIVPVGEAPALNAAAFATTLGDVTEVIDTDRGAALLRSEERLSADEAALAEVPAEFRQQVLADKQTARLDEWLTVLRARANLKSFVEALEAPP